MRSHPATNPAGIWSVAPLSPRAKVRSMTALSSLRPRERSFISHLVNDPSGSGTQAAHAAGYAKGGAASVASRLLQKPLVQEALEEYKERIQAANVVDSTWVLRELLEGAMFKISDVVDPETGTILPIDQWPQRADRMCSSITVVELFEGTGKDQVWKGYTKKLTFESRMARLEKIGRHKAVQAFEPESATNVMVLDVRKYDGSDYGGGNDGEGRQESIGQQERREEREVQGVILEVSSGVSSGEPAEPGPAKPRGTSQGEGDARVEPGAGGRSTVRPRGRNRRGRLPEPE